MENGDLDATSEDFNRASEISFLNHEDNYHRAIARYIKGAIYQALNEIRNAFKLNPMGENYRDFRNFLEDNLYTSPI